MNFTTSLARVLPSGRQFEIAHGAQRAVVVEVGAGLRRFLVGPDDVLDGYAEDDRCTDGRGQVLVPWPNRLRDGRYRFEGEDLQVALTEPAAHNAIHGLVRWLPFAAVERSLSEVVLRATLFPQSGYPFHLEVEVAYRLDTSGMSVTTTARNVGRRPAPYGAGMHPYLLTGAARVDEAVLRAPGRTRLITDDQQIPVGEEPVDGTPYDFRAPRAIGGTQLDTAYTDLDRDADGRARVELEGPDRRRIVLWMDEAHTHLMLFTGDTLPEPARRRRSLGVEPMTCAPNAFASGDGLRVLEPGASFRSTWGLSADA